MQAADGTIRLSATDLANHLACGHLTTLNLTAAKGGPSPPYWHDPHVEALRLRGIEHERRYIEHLQAQGLVIRRLEDTDDVRPAVERTVEAMRSGADVIVQPALADGRWHGRASCFESRLRAAWAAGPMKSSIRSSVKRQRREPFSSWAPTARFSQRSRERCPSGCTSLCRTETSFLKHIEPANISPTTVR